MKKVIKVAGYQGDASVHTRSMNFFIKAGIKWLFFKSKLSFGPYKLHGINVR